MAFHTLKTRHHPNLPSNACRGIFQDTEATPRILAEGKNIKTRFLLLSDTHSCELFPSDDEDHAFRDPLPKADVLLHAGDLSWHGDIAEYRRTFNVLRSARAELKIVIAGNHDWTLDEPYMLQRYQTKNRTFGLAETSSALQLDKHLQVVRDKCKEAWELWTGSEAREAGIVYLEEGTHTFMLSNGARLTIYTSPFSPEFCGWAFAYPRECDRFNMLGNSMIPSQVDGSRDSSKSVAFIPPEPIPDWPAVDVVMTHGPPMFHLDQVPRRNEGIHVGCINLTAALERVRPRLSVFGHIHEGWGAEKVVWKAESPGVKGLRRFADKTGVRQSELQQGIGDAEQWTPGEGTEKLSISLEETIKVGFAYIDATEGNSQGLKWGKESLLVNAAILNRRSNPVQAPWIVDLDLAPAPQNTVCRTNDASETCRI